MLTESLIVTGRGSSLAGLNGSVTESARDDESDIPLYIGSCSIRDGLIGMDEMLPLVPKKSPSFFVSGWGGGEWVPEDVMVAGATGCGGVMDAGVAFFADASARQSLNAQPAGAGALFLDSSCDDIKGNDDNEERLVEVFGLAVVDGTPTLFSSMNARRALTQSSEASRASFDSLSSCLTSASSDLKAAISLRSKSTSGGSSSARRDAVGELGPNSADDLRDEDI